MASLRDAMVGAKVFAIRLVIFVLMLGTLEFGARIYEPAANTSLSELGLEVQPYMMFTAGSGSNLVWQDIINNHPVPSTIKFNNFGFAEGWDYALAPDAEYIKAHAKKPGERLILITGGSVVHGVGATANDKTIAAQLQRHLNEHSTGPRYRVVNIGMGSWISYQQFVGLSLFGLPLDPDWIVVMDAHNDSGVACPQGSGAGAPLQWPKLVYLMNGGALNETNPIIDAAVRRSALVRLLTGIKPKPPASTPRELIFDKDEPDARFRVKIEGLTFSEEDKQVDFYLQAQRNVLALFSQASVILSTQPYYYNNAVSPSYRTAFAPDAGDAERAVLRSDLDRFIQANKNTPCTSQIAPQALGYFSGRSALALNDFVKSTQTNERSRRIMYMNTEAVFPYDPKLRAEFFIDNAHMSDAGQDRVGEFFANAILNAEKGADFDFPAFARQHGIGPSSR